VPPNIVNNHRYKETDEKTDTTMRNTFVIHILWLTALVKAPPPPGLSKEIGDNEALLPSGLLSGPETHGVPKYNKYGSDGVKMHDRLERPPYDVSCIGFHDPAQETEDGNLWEFKYRSKIAQLPNSNHRPYYGEGGGKFKQMIESDTYKTRIQLAKNFEFRVPVARRIGDKQEYPHWEADLWVKQLDFKENQRNQDELMDLIDLMDLMQRLMLDIGYYKEKATNRVNPKTLRCREATKEEYGVEKARLAKQLALEKTATTDEKDNKQSAPDTKAHTGEKRTDHKSPAKSTAYEDEFPPLQETNKEGRSHF